MWFCGSSHVGNVLHILDCIIKKLWHGSSGPAAAFKTGSCQNETRTLGKRGQTRRIQSTCHISLRLRGRHFTDTEIQGTEEYSTLFNKAQSSCAGQGIRKSLALRWDARQCLKHKNRKWPAWKWLSLADTNVSSCSEVPGEMKSTEYQLLEFQDGSVILLDLTHIDGWRLLSHWYCVSSVLTWRCYTQRWALALCSE